MAETAPHDVDLRRALLERIAESSHLKRTTRLRDLLLYLGERALKNGNSPVHEQEVGHAVFGRPVAYDTNIDNIVRASVSDLRKRIEAYFKGEGAHETLILEVPRGSYLPVFKDLNSEKIGKEDSAAAAFSRAPVWLRVALLLTAFGLGVLAGGWREYRAVTKSVTAWRYSPTLSSFWKPLLESNANVDVVMEDSSFLIQQNLAKQTFPLYDYLNHDYAKELQSQPLTSEIHDALNLLEGKDLVRTDEVRLMTHIMALDPAREHLRMYYARDFDPKQLTSDSLVLLGSPTSNPWVEAFDSQLNFYELPDALHTSPVLNRAPRAKEQKIYTTGGTTQYCVIAYFSQPAHNGNVLLIEGTTSEATEAGGNFLLSEQQMEQLEKILAGARLSHFELLLKVSLVQGTPLTATLESYRIYPDAR